MHEILILNYNNYRYSNPPLKLISDINGITHQRVLVRHNQTIHNFQLIVSTLQKLYSIPRIHFPVIQPPSWSS